MKPLLCTPENVFALGNFHSFFLLEANLSVNKSFQIICSRVQGILQEYSFFGRLHTIIQ